MFAKLVIQTFYKHIYMDNLTQTQYQSILKYMEDHHEQNFQTAWKILSQHNFDLNLVKKYRNNGNQGNNGGGENGEDYRDIDEAYELEQMKKMKKYLLKRACNRRRNNIRKCGDCIKNFGLSLVQKLAPQMIKMKLIRSRFHQIYQDQAVIELRFRNINQALEQAKKNIKNLIIIVSEARKNHCIVQFLKKKKLLQKIGEGFEIFGILEPEFNSENSLNEKVSQSSRIMTQTQISSIFQNVHPPSILFVRECHTQDLQIVKHFHGQTQILSINEQTVKKLKQEFKVVETKQTQMARRIKQKLYNQVQLGAALRVNQQMMMGNGVEHGDHVNGDNQPITAQRYMQNKRQGKIIAEQNKEYQQMEKKKKEKEQAQLKKQQQIEELIQQRNCRKLSLPQQPSEATIGIQNIIKIIFRCPNGDNISRKFDKKQKCEMLFTWVELNDDIEFEDDDEQYNRKASELRNSRNNSNQKVIVKQRKFDLLYSYPPESLKEKMSMKLEKVFEGEDQVKILIREQ